MRSFFHGFLALAVAGLPAGLTGCGSSSSDDSSSAAATAIDAGVVDSGITDVKSACLARKTWGHSGGGDCALCLSVAPQAPCTCTSDRSDGLCSTQGAAVTANTDCTSALQACVTACGTSDCDCQAACYSGHDSCLASQGALQGCLLNVCTERCE